MWRDFSLDSLPSWRFATSSHTAVRPLGSPNSSSSAERDSASRDVAAEGVFERTSSTAPAPSRYGALFILSTIRA